MTAEPTMDPATWEIGQLAHVTANGETVLRRCAPIGEHCGLPNMGLGWWRMDRDSFTNEVYMTAIRKAEATV